MKFAIQFKRRATFIRSLFTSLLLYGLLTTLGSPPAALATDAIHLIPLPEASQPEAPLNQFLIQQSLESQDPEAVQLKKRLTEMVGEIRVRHEYGTISNGFGRLGTDTHDDKRRRGTPDSAAPARYSKKYKSTEPSQAARKSQAVELGNRQGLFGDQSGEQLLQVKMRPIGSPRHIAVKDIERSKALMEHSADFSGDRDIDEQKVRTFLDTYRADLRIDQPAEELILFKNQCDGMNRCHFRFKQQYKGLPVWPAELLVHLDPDGNVDLVNGAYIPTPRKISTTPVVDAGQAIRAARAHVPECVDCDVSEPQLIIYGALDRPARLAWKMALDVSADAHWIVVVDALNGRILTGYNTIPHANVDGSGQDLFGVDRQLNVWLENGTYSLKDTSKSMFEVNKGNATGMISIFDAANQPPTDEPKEIPRAVLISSRNSDSGWLRDGVSAAWVLSNVYDYFLQRHNRNSIDDNGCDIQAVVRLGLNFDNAFWDGANKAMFFGDASPYAGALDVVAHEVTHGVTQETAGLVYEYQSGALDEAMSDIFGAMVEAYVEGAPDWVMGEDLGYIIRDIQDPGSLRIDGLGPYPSKMSEYYKLNNTKNGDLGGVHVNSTIISHAYYLLAEGLAGAIGYVDAEQIFYRALTVHLTAQSDFIDARLNCIQAAKELFGTDSHQALATAEAFDAVEIYDSAPIPIPNPAPVVDGEDAFLFVAFDPQRDGLRLARRESALGDENSGNWLSDSEIASSRPSVTADGTIAAFVTADNDFCMTLTDGSMSEVCFDQPGRVHSVGMSPDGNRFGFVMLDESGNPENSIMVIDLVDSEQSRILPLVAPVTDGMTVDSIEMADTMVFTSNNRYLIYDALDVLRLDDGSQIASWSIFAIDLITGNTQLVVPPTKSHDIAFPAISHTSDDIITFEAVSHDTGESTVYAGNLRTGKVNAIAAVGNTYAVPGFSGDDSAICYAMPSEAQWTGHAIYRQPVANDHITPEGSPTLLLEDADMAVAYRRGAYHQLTVSNQDSTIGTVISNVGGINCGDTCSYIYPKGTTVTLTARPYSLSTFKGWSGACSGTGDCTVTLDLDQNVTATFAQEVAPQGDGDDSAGGEGGDSGGGGGCFIDILNQPLCQCP